MTNSSLIAEFYALVLLLILALFFYDVSPMRGYVRRRRVFAWSMVLCGVSIFVHIFCKSIEEAAAFNSPILVLALTTCYFLTTWLMLTLLSYYVLLRLYEFVYDEQKLNRAAYSAVGIFVVSAALLMLNIPSGALFYIDDVSLAYCTGPLNAFSYLTPVGDIVLVLVCALINRKNINRMAKKMVYVIVPVSSVLLCAQYASHDHRINGVICVTVLTVVFITYNGGRSDQDSITNMENRRYLITETSYRLKNRQPFQLVMVKLRCLSHINRLYGEGAGNVILFEIGDSLQSLSEDGRVYRYGDDEFVILYSNIDAACAKNRLDVITNKMMQAWMLGSQHTYLGFSTLELTYSGENWEYEDISGYLSEAMHYAYSNEVSCLPFKPEIMDARKERERLVFLMREALQKGRFEVWYQPSFYHDSQMFESAEALLRMYDEKGHLVSPTAFIPVAEETGLIDEITPFVLERVCAFLKRGEASQIKTVSVNIPVRQLINPTIREEITSIVERSGISPEQIRLEVTERDVEHAGDAPVSAMQTLMDKGYLFMLDDFGIGYSNISRILDLPFDCIKLDRSLVVQMKKDARRWTVIKDYLVPLLHQMGRYVVAEGVETKEQLELVLGCNINRVQGFYFARPMPERELIRFLGTQGTPLQTPSGDE